MSQRDPDQPDPYKILIPNDSPFRWTDKCRTCTHTRADHVLTHVEAVLSLQALGTCRSCAHPFALEDDGSRVIAKDGRSKVVLDIECECEVFLQ